MKNTDKKRLMVLIILLDVSLPLSLYLMLHQLGISDFLALSFGAGVSAIRIIFGLIHNKSKSIFSLLIICFFLIGMISSFMPENSSFTIIKNSLFTFIFSLIMIGSLFLGRPLLFYFGSQLMGRELYEEKWKKSKSFRHGLRMLTFVWGIVYFIECILRFAIVFTFPASLSNVILPPLMLIGIFGLILWSRVYLRQIRGKTSKKSFT